MILTPWDFAYEGVSLGGDVRLVHPLMIAAAALSAVACDNDGQLIGQDDLVQPPVYATESFAQAPLPKVDLLWVIDNTGSMQEEQAALASGFEDLVSQLDAASLAYHLGVVSTDPNSELAGVLLGDPWIITPNAEDPALAFARAAQVGTDGLGPEAGLAAMELALSESLKDGENRGFRRNDASLVVVVVSDDDDHSEPWLGDDPVAVAERLLWEESHRTGLPASMSALIGAPQVGCQGPGGAALPGDRYAALAQATGGRVGDICAADLGPVLDGIAELSSTFPVRFELQSAPYEDELRVSVNGLRQDSGWALETAPAAVVFDLPPPAGAVIRIRYRLPPDEEEAS